MTLLPETTDPTEIGEAQSPKGAAPVHMSNSVWKDMTQIFLLVKFTG